MNDHGEVYMMKESFRNEYIVRYHVILENVHMELRLTI